MSCITNLIAREIIDSRGNPTVEVDTLLEDGSFGRASVPSGSCSGDFQVHELRDNDKRYQGQGVSRAVERINSIVALKLKGMEVTQQQQIDTY